MANKNRGLKAGVIMALKHCSAGYLNSAKSLRPEMSSATDSPRSLRTNIDMESYLAIPTFIRQGKTLGI